MNKTLRLSFEIKSTYQVNSILYHVRQLPVLKKILPANIYQVQGFKIFAQSFSILRQIVSTFVKKALYLGAIYFICSAWLVKVPQAQAYLHVLFFLTILGAIINTSLMQPTWDKYYAMILLGMDAKEYTLWNSGCELVRMAIGFLPFSLLVGLFAGCPIWICAVFPLCVVSGKLVACAVWLRRYRIKGRKWLDKDSGILQNMIAIPVFLLMAFGLPAMGICVPTILVQILFCLWIPLGLLAAKKIIKFSDYRAINQQILYKMVNQMDVQTEDDRKKVHAQITADKNIQSNRSGLEYLNELFVKRHKRILWSSSRIIALITILVATGIVVVQLIFPETKGVIHNLFIEKFSLLAFLMYFINRGTSVTKAMFVNCDHSLLTYSVYRKPQTILRMFQIRLKELVKINSLPALSVSAGVCLILYTAGGMSSIWGYVQVIVAVFCMSVFFSTHYLTLYYLLQPYNQESEEKNLSYSILTGITYFLCYSLYQWELPLKVFGITCTLFCVIYCIIACILVYFLAPKRFRIRR